jgi:hypothetical protein
MTDILDIVCKGIVITAGSYETIDVPCKGTVVIGPRRCAVRTEPAL